MKLECSKTINWIYCRLGFPVLQAFMYANERDKVIEIPPCIIEYLKILCFMHCVARMGWKSACKKHKVCLKTLWTSLKFVRYTAYMLHPISQPGPPSLKLDTLNKVGYHTKT